MPQMLVNLLLTHNFLNYYMHGEDRVEFEMLIHVQWYDLWQLSQYNYRLWADSWGSASCTSDGMFHFTAICRIAFGPILHPACRVPGVLSPGVKAATAWNCPPRS